MIRSPYNFIPLSEEVYYPNWAEKISHDIPFSDGLSGKILLKIVAQTPIFVRNSEDHSFSKTNDNRYFIPGTSIKGAIRNILEIMSHGKIRMDKNRLFAQREWDNKDLYNLKSKQLSFRCGWLKWNKEDGYHIVDCGKPYRIGHDRIDDFLEENIERRLFEEYFKKNCDFNLNKETYLNNEKYDPKTAIFKYKLIGNVNLKDLGFNTDLEHASNGGFHRVKVVSDSREEFRGTIVFTGQPDKWMYPRPEKLTKGAGKFYEFVFKNPESNARKYKISDDDYKSYLSIYKDSPDWNYWYEKVDSDGIPVFFMDDKGNLKWGLALLFKLPYEKTAFETVYDSHKKEDYDLADCIFGSEQNGSLKGRVSFGHAFCTSTNMHEMNECRLVLNSPKASYYPTYIKQDGANGKTSKYKTYNDGQISGWKRYVLKNTHTSIHNQEEVNDQISSVLYPLPSDSCFNATVTFHNLKPEELGALLAALTFFGHPECFHQLGQGKPYGYGRVKISSKLEVYNDKYKSFDIETFLAKYESVLLENNMSVNASELIALASELKSGTPYEYMNLSVKGSVNEFQQVKKEKYYLMPIRGLGSGSWLKKRKDELAQMNALSQKYKDEYEEIIIKKEEENLRREEEEKQRQKDILKLEGEAELLFAEKKYLEAIKKFQDLYQKTKDESILSKIESCEEGLNNQIMPLSEFLKDSKVSSIPAFTTSIEKKWMIPNNKTILDNDEINSLIEFLSEAYNRLNVKDKKKWNNQKDWNKLQMLLNFDLYSRIVK